MVENTFDDPFYTGEQMDDALVRTPFLRETASYRATLEKGGFDVGFVYGAPNDYESRTRFMGAQSDVLHNRDFGNDAPEVLIVPEKEQEAVDQSDLEMLEGLGCDVRLPDRELYTTADDVKSALDVAGESDTVHGFTSDYHGLKCDITGKAGFDNPRSSYRTFAFDTDIGERQNILKHNFFMQTGDTVRQLYKLAKEESDY